MCQGIRDLAGNYLQTNLDDPPFDVRYVIELPAPLDFGDTPDPAYATLLASDGPRHVLVPNIYLGAGVDAELDAKIDSEANGDLFDDGVQFEGPITPQRLGDGVDHRFDERHGQCVDRLQRGWRVPALAGADPGEVTGPTRRQLVRRDRAGRRSRGHHLRPFPLQYRRGARPPTGRADNGEVEDYQVEIVDIAPPTAVDDDYELDEDTVLTVSAAEGVLANDQNPQGGLICRPC